MLFKMIIPDLFLMKWLRVQNVLLCTTAKRSPHMRIQKLDLLVFQTAGSGVNRSRNNKTASLVNLERLFKKWHACNEND